MGVQMMDSGGGGKKNLDVEINLIPMIDLLMVMICFLLITAVWTQLARLNATQQTPGQNAPMERPPEEKIRLVLQINDTGFTLASTAGERIPIPKKGAEYDFDKLRDELQAVHRSDPNRRDLVVSPEDGVVYKNIVQAMDTALSENYPEISVSDGSGL